MKLDFAASNTLNIFPTGKSLQHFTAAVKVDYVDSLFTMLNKCKTTIGTHLLNIWLKQPLQDLEQINHRHSIIQLLILNPELLQNLQNHFQKLPDIVVLSQKFYKIHNGKKSSANLSDGVKTYDLVCTLRKLAVDLSDILNSLPPSDLKTHFKCWFEKVVDECLVDFEKLEELIEEAIDIRKARIEEYVVKPGFSDELRELESERQEVLNKMEEEREKVEDLLRSEKGVKLVESKSMGFVYEIKKKEGYEEFRDCKRHFRQLTTTKTNISFTDPVLKSFVEQYQRIHHNYLIEQKGLVMKVLHIVATYYPVMETVSAIISEADVLCAFALVSDLASPSYVKPIINQQANLILKDSRHPILESNGICISNDCTLLRDSVTMKLITGPNCGGKSTYIRQVALSVYLAHIGCFVPCSYAEIPITDCIIARVGASDSQINGISTFMNEMIEASSMIETATPRTLILMDELGRGTATNEGFGIAWAIAEHIVKEIKAFCLFATHFHEMTVMEQEVGNVKNYYVSADVINEKLVMKYKIKQGVIDRSYGINVAQLLKFPQEIIQEAQDRARVLEDFSFRQQID